jgi:hypothetical protein
MINDGSNMKINSGKGSGYRSSKVSGETQKDFKKILAKERREDRGDSEKKEVGKEDKNVKGKENYEDVALKLEVDEITPKKGVSLFDLAGVSKEGAGEEVAIVDADELAVSEFPKEMQDESLSALFKGYGSKEKLKALQEEILMESQMKNQATAKDAAQHAMENQTIQSTSQTQNSRQPMEDLVAESAGTGTKEGLAHEKGRQAAKFAQEQQDLAAINPLNALPPSGVSQASNAKEAQQPGSIAAQMKEIVDQIINKLYTIDTSGRTNTLIQLKHPPLFAGSSIVITSYSTAKGEFNIAFENLTQAAKQLLDMKENQEALKFALDQKGYTVHIITATTLTEISSLVKGEGAQKEREEREQGGSSKNKEEQEKQE